MAAAFCIFPSWERVASLGHYGKAAAAAVDAYESQAIGIFLSSDAALRRSRERLSKVKGRVDSSRRVEGMETKVAGSVTGPLKRVRYYDVFNGDADGLCALHQLRLADPFELAA